MTGVRRLYFVNHFIFARTFSSNAVTWTPHWLSLATFAEAVRTQRPAFSDAVERLVRRLRESGACSRNTSRSCSGGISMSCPLGACISQQFLTRLS